MPLVAGGPEELNDLLESAYQACIKAGGDKETCSKKAWGAAKNAGWYQDKDGNWVKSSLETRDLSDVEIFMPGFWGGKKYTKEDIDEIVRNTNELLEKGEIKIPGKIKHDEKQNLIKQEGINAVGWVTRVKKKAGRILADFAKFPLRLYELFNAGAFRPVSVEIYPDYKNHGQVLRAVAFLGADIPEVKGLLDIKKIADIEALYHSVVPGLYEEDEFVYDVCYFDEEGGMFREERGGDRTMDRGFPTKVYTIDEFEKICPECAQKMRERGIRSIEVATIIETFEEAYREFKASGQKEFQWRVPPPRGWDKSSLESFWNSIGGSVTACMKRIEGHVTDPGAFCASLKDVVTGTTGWRSEKTEHIEGGEGKMTEQELKAKQDELAKKEEAIKLREKDLETKETDLAKREAEAKLTTQKLSEIEQQRKKEQIDTFIEKLKSEGRLLPAHEEHIRRLLEMADDKNIIKFGEKKEDKTVRDILMGFLSSQPEIVKFQELLGHSGDGKPYAFKFTEQEQKEIAKLSPDRQDWLVKLTEEEVAMLNKLSISPIDYVKFNEPPKEK